MVVLIGRHWLAADAAGHRRIDDPKDLHRLEIETALRLRVRVVPALLEGARMPAVEQLPDSLAPLARRQAIGIDDEDFDEDVDRL